MPSKLLILDSEHRVSGGSPNKFTVSMKNSNLSNIKQVSLILFRSINSQYNVSQSNNVIEYSYDGVDKKVTVPVGQYSVTTFITAVNSLQTAFVLDINDLNLRFTWTSNGLPLTIYSTPSVDELLGLNTDLEDLIGGFEMQSPLLPDLSGLSVIHVASDRLSHGNSILSNQTTGNILSSVPVNSPFGFPLVYTSDSRDNSDNTNFQVPQDISQVDIELLDHNYRPANLLSEVHIVLKVIY